MDLIVSIWNFNYALVPCLIALLVFEIPNIIRRLTRKVYVPVYFAFFPFGYSDELYAKYFDEDYFWEAGGPYKEEEMPNAKIRIIWLSVLSFVLSVFLTPFVTALFCVYFLNEAQLIQFFWTLTLVKATMLCSSLYNLRFRYVVTELVPIPYIGFLYLIYLATLLLVLQKSIDWIAPVLATDGIFGIALGVTDFLIFDVGVYILLVSVFGWLVPWRLTQFKRVSADEEEMH